MLSLPLPRPRPLSSRRSLPGETPPSRVIHVRGLPAYTTESELLTLCTPFGNVIRVLLLQQQQQAFVQMATVEVSNRGWWGRKGGGTCMMGMACPTAFVCSRAPPCSPCPHPRPCIVQAASALLGRYTMSPATIRSKQVFFQYSNRTEIKAPATPNNNSSNNPTQQHTHGNIPQQQHTQPTVTDFKGEHQSSANAILLVTVLNVRVPVTLDHLHTIFKPYGEWSKRGVM